MKMPEEKVTDETLRAAVHDGVVTIRQLSHNTSLVVDLVSREGLPVVITRRGRIVASLTPVVMRTVVDQLIAQNGDLRARLNEGERALESGELRRADDVLEGERTTADE
jgi:prevent-host-death family protein